MSSLGRPLLTFTTDFGPQSTCVAQMKGVVLSIVPDALLVDLTHAIRPYDIRYGAVLLADAVPQFPEGTIHLAVVDPGVGTDRRILAATIGSHTFVAPDNGLLSFVAAKTSPTQIVSIEKRELFREPVAPTFHGRDIMAPAAAHLAAGRPIDELGPAVDDWSRIPWPTVKTEPGSVAGAVLLVDSFGNIVTNIEAGDLDEALRSQTISVSCGEQPTRCIARTYADFPKGRQIALIGSHGRLEIAVVGGNAAQALGVGIDAPVVVEW